MSLNTLVSDNRVVHYRKEVIMFDHDEEGLNFSRRKCLRCEEIVEMADHWWEFISLSCEPCFKIELREWNQKRKARNVKPPEGESY